ncbi:MAG: DUF1707 SHOCT-like domain-containing protein [Acidimicrobiales bacterium]
MSSTSPPPGPWWEAIRRTYVPPSDMRVSDAERHAMSDVLSRHYAEGRLDDSEFQDRLSRAMSAKTRGDFAGLTYDLPPFEGQPLTAPPLAPHPRRGLAHLLVWAVIGFAILSLASAWSWVAAPHIGWLVVAVVAVAVLARRGHHHHRHHVQGSPEVGYLHGQRGDGQSYI